MQTILRFSENMVGGDKTNIAFDSEDMRHSHKFNDLQSTCHSPELESENETLRVEVANLKREMMNRALVDSSTVSEKTQMLERKNQELVELIEELKLENKQLFEQSKKNFSKNVDDVIEQDEVSSAAGDSPSVRSTISHKLKEKAVSGLVGIVDLANKSFCSTKQHLNTANKEKIEKEMADSKKVSKREGSIKPRKQFLLKN